MSHCCSAASLLRLMYVHYFNFLSVNCSVNFPELEQEFIASPLHLLVALAGPPILIEKREKSILLGGVG